jgi:hypothetical protein
VSVSSTNHCYYCVICGSRWETSPRLHVTVSMCQKSGSWRRGFLQTNTRAVASVLTRFWVLCMGREGGGVWVLIIYCGLYLARSCSITSSHAQHNGSLAESITTVSHNYICAQLTDPLCGSLWKWQLSVSLHWRPSFRSDIFFQARTALNSLKHSGNYMYHKV